MEGFGRCLRTAWRVLLSTEIARREWLEFEGCKIAS
jgi:hypothetical protein